MKRFRRHGHESHREKLKQELFQFNKVSKTREISAVQLNVFDFSGDMSHVI